MSIKVEKPLYRGRTLSFAIGAIAGFIVWAAAPQLTGHKEPWDSDSGFYFVYLLATGALAGVAVPRHFWACPSGIYVGQAVAMLALLQIGSLAPLGLIVALPIMSVVNLIGWCAGAAVRILISKVHARISQAAR